MVIVYKSSQWQNPFILDVCTGNVDQLIPQSPLSLHWAWVASHVVEIFQRTKNRFVTTAIFLPEQMLRKCGPGKYENTVWSSNDIPGPMCGAYHLAMHISYTEVISIDIYYVHFQRAYICLPPLTFSSFASATWVNIKLMPQVTWNSKLLCNSKTTII